MNFIIPNVSELEGKKVTIISYQDVSPEAAWEAFQSALEVNGYALSVTGKTAKIVKASEAGQRPGKIGSGEPSESDAYVTQLITLENTRVDDMAKIIQNMVGPDAKIVSYPPTNTMIITDTGANIRKIYRIMKELDVASPRSTMEIYVLAHASASEVKQIIEQLYGTASGEDEPTAPTRASSRQTTRSTRAGASRRPETAAGSAEPTSAGDESKFIAQVIDDERTNALIVLANEDGHQAVRELIAKVDVDVDPQGEIHVVYLEHAKAEEVAAVLASLSEGGGARSGTPAQRRTNPRTGAPGAPASPATRTTPARGAAGTPEPEGGGEDSGSALAAFDSGMRIAADEATNSLVIIANTEDFRVVESVISKLDIERKQVFVDAVILELSSEDTMSLGLAAHLPQKPTEESAGFIGAQLGATSLGLTPDALSGLAIGVFGPTIEVPLADGTVLPVPAFGIVMNAIKTSGSTNIISNPSLMTMDNEEATIIVGRKIPFPTTSGLNNLGQPVTSFQREDVAITMKIIPRINSSNYVTLELEVEVQEVEESAQNAAVLAAGGGFITSQRKLDTVALVADNETMVIGGLVGTTEGAAETKVPVLGDIPLIGALFRSNSTSERKTNLMVFLTPHIVDEPDDMIEIQRVKEAQRQEFLRRFYGKSREQFWTELRDLLRYSMNFVDEPSTYRGPNTISHDLRLDDLDLSQDTRDAAQKALDEGRKGEPGEGAGETPEDDLDIDDDTPPPPPAPE
jgi:general secretion pathway protein D